MRSLRTEAVAGDSMRPTLVPGDWLLARRAARIRPGDIVVARRPDRPDLRIIKRATNRTADGWWLEGDNPPASDDSRLFGPVPPSLIESRILLRYHPTLRIYLR